METWRPQIYRAQSPKGSKPEVVANAIAIASVTAKVSINLPPVFTLGHLAHYTETEYHYLRAIASRVVVDPYRIFRIRKRPLDTDKPRFRIICVPETALLAVQRWINVNVLAHAKPHHASTAFAKECSIKKAAERHCCARWLIQMDVANFFESISEIRVARVFVNLGYQPLISFELARICTRLGSLTSRRRRSQWQAGYGPRTISAYTCGRLGHLPQGAPTSPMLANMSVYDLDAQLAELAGQKGLEYSRYADDITFSTDRRDFDRLGAVSVIGRVYALMGKFGLSPNTAKTRISSPGSRKVVLGLLVNGPRPRLTREFRYGLLQHLHYLLSPKVGPARHAQARDFAAIAGMKHHIQGLIDFAHDIELDFAADCQSQFDQVAWPI